MKRKSLYWMIGGYIIFILLGFIVISVFTSNYDQNYLEDETASSLYAEANSIAESYGESYYSSEITLSQFRTQLTNLSTYLDADIYIISIYGNMLISTSSDEIDVIDDFDIIDFGSDYYYVGNFYDIYDEDMICVYSPITNGYKVRSYCFICRSVSSVTDLKNEMLNGSYITLVILFVLSLVIMVIFIFIIYRPLNKVIKAGRSYAAGEYVPIENIEEREDEIGFLAVSMNSMAAELYSLKNDQHKFVSNVSHDFRSPLTSIKGYAQAMADGTIPPELQGKYLNVIIFESERLEKLTQGLLELNKYGSHGMFLDMSVFDINKVIRRSVLSFEGISKEKMLSFDLILTGEELYVKADEAKIDQVLHNLIDNAVKFSKNNSLIIIETTAKNGKVFVSIKDSGIGIPKNNIEKIWTRFYKSDLSRGKDKKGTGLGLAIVKDIIQAHKENINVISTEGVGTEFIFTLTMA